MQQKYGRHSPHNCFQNITSEEFSADAICPVQPLPQDEICSNILLSRCSKIGGATEAAAVLASVVVIEVTPLRRA